MPEALFQEEMFKPHLVQYIITRRFCHEQTFHLRLSELLTLSEETRLIIPVLVLPFSEPFLKICFSKLVRYFEDNKAVRPTWWNDGEMRVMEVKEAAQQCVRVLSVFSCVWISLNE